jgi:SAM-dependent methyltransferase
LIPKPIKQRIKWLTPRIWKYYCPICDRFARVFGTFGLIPRANARCPTCGALERHRFVWTFLQRRTDLFDGRPKRMLHIAPEKSLSKRFAQINALDYVTADLYNPAASLRLDITDMPGVPDKSVDVVYCSHVLEHVSDDRRAMREFARILRPGGWAVLLVPITVPETIEDPSITDPKERERLFGQHDHVRRYGPDFARRLEEAGFHVRAYDSTEVLGQQRERFAVTPEEWPIYYCALRT